MYDFGMYDVRGNKKATLKVAFLFVEFLSGIRRYNC